jgi:hypothetical protein
MPKRQSRGTSAALSGIDASDPEIETKCKENADFACLALQAFGLTATNPAIKRQDQGGGKSVKFIVDVLKVHENNVEVQCAGFSALAAVVLERPDQQNHAHELDVLRFTARTMGKHAQSLRLQITGSVLLASMILIDDKPIDDSRIVAAGREVFRALVAGLNNFPSDTELIHHLFRTLMCINKTQNQTLKDFILSEHAPEAILTVMNGCLLRDTETMTGATITLYFILEDFCLYSRTRDTRKLQNEQVRAFRQAAMPTVLNVLAEHLRNIDVRRHALKLLWTFSHEPFFAEQVHQAKARGMPMLIKCLEAKGNDTDMKSDLYECVAYATSKHAQNKDVCAKLGAIDIILSLSKEEKDNQVNSRAVQMLECISSGHEENLAHWKASMPTKQAKKLTKSMINAREERDPEFLRKEIGLDPERLKETNAMLQARLGVSPSVCQTAVAVHEIKKMMEECAGCGKTSSDCGLKQLLKCSACTIAPCYCGHECQKACWPAHKAECKANRKTKT